MTHEAIDWIGGYPFASGVNSPVDWTVQTELQKTPEIKATPSGEQPISHDLRAGKVYHAATPVLEVKPV